MPRLVSPGTAFKEFRRLRQIVTVFARHGFGEVLDQMRLWEHASIERHLFHRKDDFSPQTAPERLRHALEELGPAFVKLGQMLSTRPDIVPLPFIYELEKLQNQVAPIPAQEIIKVIETELNQPLSDVFIEFDDVPVAAASLSQVHRALLRTRAVVAVKVQRPGIADVVHADLDILRNLASLLKTQLKRFGILNPVGLVEEFARNLQREMDFRVEAGNMQHYSDNFRDIDYIHIPCSYPELTTSRLLTMEYIAGIGITDVNKLAAAGYDLKLIAHHIADVSLKSAFEHGFFHADPHPGNVFVLPGNVISLLDFGMMGTVSPSKREDLARLLLSLMAADEKRTARAVSNLVETAGTLDMDSLRRDVSRFIDDYARLLNEGKPLNLLLLNLWRLAITYQLGFDTHLVWLLKAVATGESISKQLDPDSNMLTYSRPYFFRLFALRFHPLHQLRALPLAIWDILELLGELPYNTLSILRQLNSGRFKVEFEHLGLEPIYESVHHASNRLALAIVLAALVISSSLLILSKLPPLWSGISIIGMSGYIVSGLLGLWLVFTILRHG